MDETPHGLAVAVAKDFASILTAWIGRKNVEEAARRNADEADPGVCHSHDFCDANEAMAEAMGRNGFPDMDPQDENAVRLWNEAWDLAVRRGFDAAAIR